MKTAVMVALLFLLSCATAPPKGPPADYKGPIVERPKLTVGDYWVQRTKRGTEKWVFLEEKNGELVFEIDGTKDRAYTNLNLGTLRRVTWDGRVTYQTDTPTDAFEFPIWVGKRWSFLQSIKSPRDGTSRLIAFEYSVEEYKAVAVQAGTFEAFRIVRNWKRVEREHSEGLVPTETVFWYAPSAKTKIKIEGPDPKELVEYAISSP
jgi:hypothetical protein